MEAKKVTALLLVVLMVGAEANSIAAKSLSSKWDFGLTANVNDYVDNTISMIIPFMKENGLDPMVLPEISEGFEVKPVLITYSAWVRFYDGFARGLINISRSGDQNVHYFAKMLRVRLELQFTNLEFIYKFLVQVMNIGPTGTLIGSLDRFNVVVDLIIDFNNDEIQLQQFALSDVGRLSVQLTGGLVSWLISPLVAVFVRIFDGVIMRVVESTIRNVAQTAIRHVNAGIRDVVFELESFN